MFFFEKVSGFIICWKYPRRLCFQKKSECNIHLLGNQEIIELFGNVFLRHRCPLTYDFGLDKTHLSEKHLKIIFLYDTPQEHSDIINRDF